MRSHVLGAALVAALITPGAALAQSGHVGAAYTDQTYDFGAIDFEVEAVNLGGQFAFGAAPFGLQIDAGYTNWGGDADDAAIWNLGAHVFNRGDRWLFGGYLGYDDIDDFNVEVWTGALETQHYLPNATVSGVLSHSIWDGPDYTITMLEGEYRHFISGNFTVHAGLGFGQADIGGDSDVWSGALGGEYMFAGAPVSVFGQYRYNSIEFGVGEIEVDALSIGVRYNWGGSLMDRNRSGAGLNRVLPIFDRFLS
jgi:hypothetical protein